MHDIFKAESLILGHSRDKVNLKVGNIRKS